MANPTKLQLQEKVKVLKKQIKVLTKTIEDQKHQLEKVEANTTPNESRRRFNKLSYMGGIDKTLLNE